MFKMSEVNCDILYKPLDQLYRVGK